MMTILRVAALAWADAMIDATFFMVQTYLTKVWEFNFTTAAGILNIWGGIYRMLPLVVLFLADTVWGNAVTLGFSGASSSVGLLLITFATFTPLVGYPCQGWKHLACHALRDVLIFSLGMGLVALGRAGRFACTQAFILDQAGDHGPDLQYYWLVISGVLVFATPFAGIFAFPYIREWYALFAASALCTISATVFFWSGRRKFKSLGPRREGSPVTDIARVFVAALYFKRSLKFPKEDEVEEKLYTVREEQFQKLSPTLILRFLHKACIIVDDDRDANSREVKRSWKICSVSDVESTKIMIRLIPMWSSLLICGVVSSIGNTYFVEQMSHMKSNIGSWNAPPQTILLTFTIMKYMFCAAANSQKKVIKEYIVARDGGALHSGYLTLALSVICCAVAAAVERRRLHDVKRHHTEVPPMSAFWLTFPFIFLALIDVLFDFTLSRFHGRIPHSMKKYRDCLSEGVIGCGYLFGALSVFVAGQISKAGGGHGWFHGDLNTSRLDRYYWVLTAVGAINLIFFYWTSGRQLSDFDEEADADFKRETDLEYFGIKKTSALGIILLHIPGATTSILAWFHIPDAMNFVLAWVGYISGLINSIPNAINFVLAWVGYISGLINSIRA